VKSVYKGMTRLIAVAILLSFMPSAKSPLRKIDQVQTIVLDAGHGGADPGSISGGLNEKDITLAITLKVGKYLKDSISDLRVLYTRTADRSVNLSDRPVIANRNEADLFISIHCNANKSASPEGSETYFMGVHKNDGNLQVAKRENSAIVYEQDYKNNVTYGGFDPNSPESHIIFAMVQNAFLNQALRISSYVEEETSKVSEIRSRGVKQAGFLVLWKTAMPGVLIETGFLSNEMDRKVLSKDSGQTVMAKSIYNAVKKYKTSTAGK
jgi:N-acetylmuramoyl-L-alanine amidase